MSKAFSILSAAAQVAPDLLKAWGILLDTTATNCEVVSDRTERYERYELCWKYKGKKNSSGDEQAYKFFKEFINNTERRLMK